MADYVLHDKFYLSSDMINVLLSSERTTKTRAKKCKSFFKV